MGINQTTREISRRRIKWYKEILTNKEDNKQLRAAVFGKLEQEDENGRPCIGISPWITFLIQDLQFLMDAFRSWIDNDGERDYRIDHVNILEMVEGSGTGNLMNTEIMDWIYDVNVDEFDSCEEVSNRKERSAGITKENYPFHNEKGSPLKCPVCEFVGTDYQRARAHFKTHDTDIMVKTILTNQCPVCDKTFTDTMCA